jgi:solute carrier family 25 carnitine/acylcarnitine transporter 20/29
MPTNEQQTKEQLVQDEVKTATSATLSGVRSLVAGGVGGVCAVLTGHPFDLVKVRLQTAEKGAYTGAVDVVRKAIAKQGPVRVYMNSQHTQLQT